MATVKARIQQKHDIEANWKKAVNFKPLAGELIVYDADSAHTTARFKIGDGNTPINDLPFVDISGELEAVPNTIPKRDEYGAIKIAIEFQTNSNSKRPVPFRLPKRTGVCYWNGTVATEFSAGSGTEEDPYIISSAEEFAKAVSYTDEIYRYFKINDNLATIYLQPESLGIQNYRGYNANIFFVGNDSEGPFYTGTPLEWNGKVITNDTRFAGCFDGNGCEIVGCYATNYINYSNQSVFGMCGGQTSIIKNLIVSQCYMKTGYRGTVLINNDDFSNNNIGKNILLQDNFIQGINIATCPNAHIGLFGGAGSMDLFCCYTRNNEIKYGDTSYTTTGGNGACKFTFCFFKDCIGIGSSGVDAASFYQTYFYGTSGFGIYTKADYPTPKDTPLLDWTAWLPVGEVSSSKEAIPLSMWSLIGEQMGIYMSNLTSSLTKLDATKRVYTFSAQQPILYRNGVYLLVANDSSNDISFYKEDGKTELPNLSNNACRTAIIFLPENSGHGYIVQMFKQSIPTLSNSFAGNQFDIVDDYRYVYAKSKTDTPITVYGIAL